MISRYHKLTPNVASEYRRYEGETWFCRSPHFENVFIVPVSAVGEEYRGSEGRTIPRKKWQSMPMKG